MVKKGKESACNAGDLGSISGLGRAPGEGNGYPLQYSGLENPHGQRSLVGYSWWGRKESDMTEQLSTAHTDYLKSRELWDLKILLYVYNLLFKAIAPRYI